MTRRRRRLERGFNLVELMIALALGLIVVLGASNVFLSNKQSYRTNTALSTIQENSRIAFELLTRDLRQARLTGCGNLGAGAVINNVNDNATTANWYADFANRGLIGFDGAGANTNPALTTGTSSGNHKTGTDNLTLIGAGGASYSLDASFVATDGLDVAEDSPGLQTGDLIVMCDPSRADIAQITGVDGSSGNFLFQIGVGTPGNSDTPGNTPAHSFTAASTLISALHSVTWYIGCNPDTTAACDPARGGTSLYRLTAAGTASPVAVTPQAQEMVRGVSALDFQYHASGASAYTEANAVASWAPTTIDAVRISMTLVGFDSSNATVAPITRQLSTIVTLRNPPKG